tara:strand:+ start:4413 stop:7238 length:2826 start_codon:yes stop_codon:yes gene_type:complete
MATDITSPEGTGTTKTPADADKKLKDKKAATNDDRTVSNLEQYILSQNIDAIKRFTSAHSKFFQYSTFRQVNGPGPQLVNRLKGIPALDVFYKIKQSALSLMQPKIRIFKVNHEELKMGPDGTPDGATVAALPVPCYREFKFSDNFGYELAASVEDYLAYESTKPSFRNVGLKSFSVHQNGETHGVIENNIDCTLELSFKSLKDLNAQPPGEPSPNSGGLRYVDLILWPPAKFVKDSDSWNPKHYQIKVLMGYTAPDLASLNGLNLSQEDMTAISNIEKMNTILSLALVSYTFDIRENGQVVLKAQYRGAIETIIGSNQVNVFQDTFRVQQGGNLDITNSAASIKTNTAHIYKLATAIKGIQAGLIKETCTSDAKCPSRKTLRDLIESDILFAGIYKKAGGPGTVMKKNKTKIKGDGEVIYKWFKEEKNATAVLALLKNTVGQFKKDLYTSFMNSLIDGNPPKQGGFGTRLFCTRASKKYVEGSMGIVLAKDISKHKGAEEQNLDALNDEDAVKSTSLAIGKSKSQIDVGRCDILDKDKLALKEETAQQLVTSVAGEAESKDKKSTKKEEDKSQKSILNYDSEAYPFYFLFLGDIIELVSRNAGVKKLDFDDDDSLGKETKTIFPISSYIKGPETGIDYPLTNVRMLLGPIEYYDRNGKIQKINLAQFPLSFNLFRAWFLNKIVKRRRTQMPLGSFVLSLVNDLVIPSLGIGFPKSLKPPKARSSAIALSLPGKQLAGTDFKVCGRESGKIAELLPMKRSIDITSADYKINYYDKVSQPMSSETMVKTSYDYWLLYVTSEKDVTVRKADPVEDLADGIYHFNIGADKGLLKSMKFSRVQIPHLAELRAEQAAEQGVDQLGQLKFPYNTDLSLIGTSLFTPGMYYYVNPSLAGLGRVESPSSLAYQMNLGGYHIVLKTTMTISRDGGFKTEINGKQTAQAAR